MKKIRAGLITVLLAACMAVGASSASADSYVGFAGTSCYMHVHSPQSVYTAGGWNEQYVSDVYNCHNLTALRDELLQLVSSGWQQVNSVLWYSWYPAPISYYGGLWGCVPGRWYATAAQAYVQLVPNGQASYASTNTEASGTQCP